MYDMCTHIFMKVVLRIASSALLGKFITATIYTVKLVHYLTVHQACEQAADASTTALHAIKEARIASNAANLAAQVIA